MLAKADLPARRRGRPPAATAGGTRERILDAALRLIAREGLAGTSMRALAREVGVRESALYAHFPSKQAIFDELVAEGGPPVVLHLLEESGGRGAEDPATFLRDLVARALQAWDEPRARLFISLMLRQGALDLPAEGRGIGATLLPLIEQVKRRLGRRFRAWMAAGLVRDDFAPEHLVWELFAPMAAIRLLYLHGHATEVQRRRGRRLAQEHVAFFLSSVLRRPPGAAAR
jgi:AcrR family transcriptional regulator